MLPPGNPVGESRFRGRDQELDHLVAAFAACRGGSVGRALVVHGSPGVGTSRLVAELRDQLRQRGLGHRWWSGRCSRRAPLPYEPMAGLLRSVPGDVGAWLAEAVPAGGGESTGLTLLAGFARRVRAATSEVPAQPVVLVVDDVDGADASTMRLLCGAVPLLDDVPVLVLFVGRSDAAGGAPHGLDAVCQGSVVVSPLEPEHIDALVYDAAPELDDVGVDAIIGAAAGRPGIALALAGAGDAERTLAALLDAVHPDAATAVLAAGLADGWLATATLTEAVGLDGGVWRPLQQRQIVVASGRPGAGAVPSSDLWVAAARRAHSGRVVGVAAAIAPALDAAAPAAVAAGAWEVAGRPVEACIGWERAADEAIATYAVETAAVALRRAIDVGGEAALGRLGRRAGELSLVAGDRIEADRLAERILPRLARTDHVGLLAALLVRYRARLEAGLADHDAALDRALEVASPACREHVEVLVVDALRRVLDDPAGAAAQATRALAEAHELDDLSAIANAAGAAGMAAAIAGDLDGGLAHFDHALDAAARAGDTAAEARLASNRVFVLWRAGRPIDVERAAAAELDRLRVRGLEALGDQLAVGRCGALLQLGRLADADEAIAAARRMRMSADPIAHLDLVAASLALARGELDRAQLLLDRVTASPAAELPEVVGERWVVASAIALARGDRRAATTAASAGLAVAAGGDVVAQWRLVLGWWSARGAPDAPGTTHTDVPELPEPEVIGAELAAVAAQVEACRRPSDKAWAAAEAAWAAVPAPLEMLRCRLAAEASRRDLDAIDRVADEARALGAFGLVAEADHEWRAAGGRRTPQRSSGLLTIREAEVLVCVGEGLTNKEIAERLYISVRTVGAHLERCMAKLAMGTRGAAVHEARRLGLID